MVGSAAALLATGAAATVGLGLGGSSGSATGLPKRSRACGCGVGFGASTTSSDLLASATGFGPLAFSHSTHMNSSGSAHAPFAT
jgi:hypothetical protein